MSVKIQISVWEKNRDIVDDFAWRYEASKLKNENDEIWGLVQTTQQLIDSLLILLNRSETETDFEVLQNLDKEIESKLSETQRAFDNLCLEME